jgi:hypothetical protein
MTLHPGHAATRISSNLNGSTEQFGWLQAFSLLTNDIAGPSGIGATPEAALRVLHCAPFKQKITRAAAISAKHQHAILRCPLSAENIPF